MNQLGNLAGNLAAILGIALCLLAGGARIAGIHYVLDFQATTLFQVGTGLMVFAVLAKLHVLLMQRERV